MPSAKPPAATVVVGPTTVQSSTSVVPCAVPTAHSYQAIGPSASAKPCQLALSTEVDVCVSTSAPAPSSTAPGVGGDESPFAPPLSGPPEPHATSRQASTANGNGLQLR